MMETLVIEGGIIMNKSLFKIVFHTKFFGIVPYMYDIYPRDVKFI